MNVMLTEEQQGSLKTLLLETSQGAKLFSLPSHISSTVNSSFPREMPYSNTTIPGHTSTLFSPPASWSGYAPSIPAMFQLFLLCIHPDTIISANIEQTFFQIAPKSAFQKISYHSLFSTLPCG